MKKLNEFIRNLQDELAGAMYGDLENGVRSLNEKATANFMKDAPRTSAVLSRIMNMEIPE